MVHHLRRVSTFILLFYIGLFEVSSRGSLFAITWSDGLFALARIAYDYFFQTLSSGMCHRFPRDR